MWERIFSCDNVTIANIGLYLPNGGITYFKYFIIGRIEMILCSASHHLVVVSVTMDNTLLHRNACGKLIRNFVIIPQIPDYYLIGNVNSSKCEK